MLHLITEFSKYIMILLILIYTYYSFAVLAVKNENREKRMYKMQTTCMILIHLLAYVLIFAVNEDFKYLILYAAEVALVLIVFLIYRAIYRNSARLVTNHMCMLMLIGLIMITRLDWGSALRQLEIAGGATVLSIFVPILIRKLKMLRRFTWFYAALGVIALGVVLVLGRATGGANLSYTIAGVTLQPSEFIKIVFVFFVACMFYKSTDFKQVCITTIAAAVHVIILVLSTDLGAALIFFVTYIVMLYVATRNPLYFAGGLLVGGGAGFVASKLFAHVKTRIAAWKDPFANYDGGGYQIAQSLFAIGTGSWFGLGLYQGKPNTIPVATSDFIFAAIVEELGGVFGICIILICLSCFLMFLNIAMQIHDLFYKLIALGLGTTYGIQVFLNIGGVIKCIPSTGVTLPLVSYGGSSILSTIFMFAIIQGLYILRVDESEQDDPKFEPTHRHRETKNVRRSKDEDYDFDLSEDFGDEEYEEAGYDESPKRRSGYDEPPRRRPGYDEQAKRRRRVPEQGRAISKSETQRSPRRKAGSPNKDIKDIW